jgi:hypothetical protein
MNPRSITLTLACEMGSSSPFKNTMASFMKDL